MTQTHPYYLASEGFIMILCERTEEMIGLKIVQGKEITDLILPSMVNEELYLVNRRTGEKISVQFLFNKGLIEEQKNDQE